jgi:L,D-transpeptidase ErfK/SrfK
LQKITWFRGSIAALLILGLGSYANAQGLPPLTHLTVGSEFKYTVKPRETLVSVGARNGIESGTLAALNGLKPKTALKPGQVLDIDNRHIVPADPARWHSCQCATAESLLPE